MGIVLGIVVDERAIDPERWKTVWLQTLQLLKAFKPPLVRLEKQQKYGLERPALVTDLEVPGEEDRTWSVCGDLVTKGVAEDITLSDVIRPEKFKFRWTPEQREMLRKMLGDIIDQDVDIPVPQDYPFIKLFTESEYKSYPIMDGKTQGNTYHKALLAVVVWIETCFPEHAHVNGYFTKPLCLQAIRYIENVLGEDAVLPLSLSPERLLNTLSRHYEGDALLAAFHKVYRGTGEDVLPYFHEHFNFDLLAKWIVDTKSLTAGDTETVNFYIEWLGAGLPLDDLCHIMLVNEQGPKFNPVTTAGDLAATWIAIPSLKRGSLDVLDPPDDMVATNASLLGAFMFDMQGLSGRRLTRYIAIEEVVETLAAHFPERTDDIDDAFRKHHEIALEKVENIGKPIVSAYEKAQERGFGMDDYSTPTLSVARLSPHQRTQLDGMAFIVQKARRVIAAEEGEGIPTDIEALIKEIITKLEKVMIWPTADAWTWIDAETDPELLWTLTLVLHAAKQNELLNICRDLMESRELVAYVYERSFEDLDFD